MFVSLLFVVLIGGSMIQHYETQTTTTTNTMVVTLSQLDAQSVPQLIQFLTILKQQTTNVQNQQFIDILISELQRQQSTGQYNNNILPALIQFIQQVQSNPNQQVTGTNTQVIQEQTNQPQTVTNQNVQLLINSLQTHLQSNPLSNPADGQQLINYILQLTYAMQNNPQKAQDLQTLIALTQKVLTPGVPADQLQQAYTLLTALFTKMAGENPNESVTLQLLMQMIQREYTLNLQKQQPQISQPNANQGLTQSTFNFMNAVNQVPIPAVSAQRDATIRAIISNDLLAPTNLIAQRGVDPNVLNLLLLYMNTMSEKFPALTPDLQAIAQSINQIYVQKSAPGSEKQLMQLIINFLSKLPHTTPQKTNAINALISWLQQYIATPTPEPGWDIKLTEGLLYLLLSIEPLYSEDMGKVIKDANKGYWDKNKKGVEGIQQGGNGIGLLGKIDNVLLHPVEWGLDNTFQRLGNANIPLVSGVGKLLGGVNKGLLNPVENAVDKILGGNVAKHDKGVLGLGIFGL